MNYKMMCRFLGLILLVEALFMLPAVIVSIYFGEWVAMQALLVAAAITGFVAVILQFIGRKSEKRFYAREGLVCVGFSWILMGMFGALPFVITGEIPNYVDALFETISGFTTTGASILNDVEVMSKGLLYWRSFTHWLGGMGVLVFVLAIATGKDSKSGFTMHLLRAESPGPSVGKLMPRMKDTTRILYLIYIMLTALDFAFLMFGDMPAFDAMCTAFGTAGTGGFGIKNTSLAGYSPYIQNVTTVFMFLFGVNFTCYYMLAIRKVKSVFKDEEFRLYIGVAISSIIIIAFNIRGLYNTVGETARHAAFQVSTVMTTTGFATADFDTWPALSKTILFVLMLLGASAGSTGGGFKCGRLLLIFKSLRRSISKIMHPEKVYIIRNNGEAVDEKTIAATHGYLVAYVIIIIVSFLIVSIDGKSMETNLSSVIACFNNIGPGFDGVGATCNYAHFGILSKLVLIVDMLAGRLEIFPILVLLSRNTWKKK